MIEQEIKTLFNKLDLGDVTQPIETVSGGFMHRMYKVCSNKGTYAVKYLNPEVMSRPDAMGINEVNNTIKRIRYIYSVEDEIKDTFKDLFND